MKLVYCLNSISYIGGLERVIVNKANVFANLCKFDVYIIVAINYRGKGFTNELSSNVKLINLDVNYYENDWKSKFYLVKDFFIKRYRHKKKLKNILNVIKPDIVISTGQAEKFFLSSIKGNWKLIREIHQRKDYRNLVVEDKPLFYKAIPFILNYIEDKFIFNKYDAIVILTKEELELNWKYKKNVFVIPNMLSSYPQEVSELHNKSIITVGRLCKSKNYSSLIKAFQYVVKKHKDWKLEIYGEGEEYTNLIQLITNLHLENNIFIKSFTNNIIDKMKNSSIFVLSSKYEGHPMVILEAMSCGLPVISYDCPCGPKDMIIDGENGYLVESGNEILLASKINLLIENDSLRSYISLNAHKSSFYYSQDNIINKWLYLFDKLKTQ